MEDRPDLKGRCGTCARFVRVIESIDENGEVKRKGECLLGVWPAPLFETSTCSQYVQKGTFTAKPWPRPRGDAGPHPPRRQRAPRVPTRTRTGAVVLRRDFDLPEEILDMNADEFREILRDVIRDELGVGEVELGGRWQGGEVVLKPGKEGTQEKRISIETLFAKIVTIRDKLRVLEQKINAHPKLAADEKLQMQGYITGCYGSLTTFNVLFAQKGDTFVGQKGDD